MYSWGSYGLGVVSSFEDPAATGPHALDNRRGTEALVIGFGALKVNLNALTIGWNGTDNGVNTSYNDSDLSVFAWVGPAAMSTANLSPEDLKKQSDDLAAGTITSGWKLIGNYADVGKNVEPDSQTLSSTVYSSNWLISAYSSSYGSVNSGSASGTLSDAGFNDAFKLLALRGATCDQQLSGSSCGPGQVPEPSGLMLLGLGLLGLATTRKWQSRRSRAAQVSALRVA
ncbi:MAG: hypothetical protein RLZZ126_661 [Pseudomonadota bacterium]